jgi:YfiR/HmsC-like
MRAGMCALLSAMSIGAQGTASPEYQSKAKSLSQFPNFIEWPETAFATPQAPFAVCVWGDFSFGAALAEATQRETFHNRKIEVRWLRKIADAHACQILFVSRSESSRYAAVLAAVHNAEVLTVGETPEFLAAGGAINFFYDQNRLQFEVNLTAATDARLVMSSQLLSLARRVVHRGEAAKG